MNKQMISLALSKAKFSGLPSDFDHPELKNVEKVLANGHFGVVFTNNSGHLTKFGKISRNEFTKSKLMAEYGLGPQVYSQKYDKYCIKMGIVRGKGWNYFDPIEAKLMIDKVIELHKKGLFHGDISPHNKNMLFCDGEINFIDFDFTYSIGSRITKELYIRIAEELAFAANYCHLFGYYGLSFLYRNTYKAFTSNPPSRREVLRNFVSAMHTLVETKRTEVRVPNDHQLFLCYQSDDSHKKYRLISPEVLDSAYFTDIPQMETFSYPNNDVNKNTFTFLTEEFPQITKDELQLLTSILDIVDNREVPFKDFSEFVNLVKDQLEDIIDRQGRSQFLQNYFDSGGNLIETVQNKYFDFRCKLYGAESYDDIVNTRNSRNFVAQDQFNTE